MPAANQRSNLGDGKQSHKLNSHELLFPGLFCLGGYSPIGRR